MKDMIVRISPFRAACAALLFGLTPFATAFAADATPVLAQQLVAPKASSKIETVLWTRRSDRYTLQVVFPRPTNRAGLRIEPVRNDTNVTLWLLKADGTAIPVNPVPTPGPSKGTLANEAAYWVSLPAGEAAVAAVLRINEEYFIEALQPLRPQ